MCPLRFLEIPSLKALTEKLSSGMPKSPKSHDQPLCAYLMGYDTHIQYRKMWNPMKRIWVTIWTTMADWWRDGQTNRGESRIPPTPQKNFVVWGIMNCPNCSSEWSISLYLLPWWAKLSKYALRSNLLFSLWWPLILDEPASSPRACVKHLKTCKTGGLRKKST